MRHLQSPFHLRHALFALQSPEGYVEALMESAREASLAPRRPGARASRPLPPRSPASRIAPSA